MTYKRIKDGFLGEKQINVPEKILTKHIRNKGFFSSLFITHIGYFPKAEFHFRERKHGCADNILIYCQEGKGIYHTAERRHELTANQFMILPPGKYHMYQADINAPWTIYWVHFSGSMINEFNNRLNTNKFILPTEITYDKQIIEVWYEMYKALENNFSAPNLAYANLCLYRFLSFFLCPDKKMSVPEVENPIDLSIMYMRSNIDKSMSVEDLAKQLQYSCSHYTTLFKKKTGLAPIEYFIRMKIHYACQLLSQSDLKIKNITDKIGYNDSFYFSRLFKKITGKSPKEYRRSVTDKKTED